MALFLRYAVRSDLGLVRTNNEDSVYAGPRLLAIADGMGGHAAGEVASKIVIEMMESLDEDRRIDDLSDALRSTVLAANRRIAAAVAERKELEGMGTTLTALRFSGSKVGLVHVGDSRAYLVRNDQLSQITHDDTYVQYLVDSGKLTEDEAKDHPRKSVILRALLGTDVELDVSMREARHGDRYLLCSDGLSDVVSAETILDTLRIDDPQEAADRLVELALRGGGPDNVTVIVADAVNSRAGGTIDDVPVIAGAFVDPAAADIPESDSAAGRAALISRPKAAGTPAPEPEKRRRRFSLRGWLFLFLVLALLASGMGAAYAWTQTQYFVGRDGTNVAIYRGVNTEVGPLKFFTVAKRTALKFDDLNPSVQSQVSDGIAANNRKSADRVVVNLRSQRLPVCPSAPPASSPAPSSSSGTASGSMPAGTVSPSPKRSAAPSRAVSSRPRAAVPGSPSARSRVSSASTRALASTSGAPTSAVPGGSATAGATVSATASAVSSAVPSSVTGSASSASPSGIAAGTGSANPSGAAASGGSGSPAAAKRECRSGP